MSSSYPVPTDETLRSRGETLHMYSAGSQVQPWVAWLEGENGEVSGFVSESGEILNIQDPAEARVGPRTKAWNEVRVAIRNACKTPPGSSGAEYYSPHNAAAIISIASNAMRWTEPNGSVEKDRVGKVCDELDTLMGFSMGFGLLTSLQTYEVTIECEPEYGVKDEVKRVQATSAKEAVDKEVKSLSSHEMKGAVEAVKSIVAVNVDDSTDRAEY